MDDGWTDGYTNRPAVRGFPQRKKGEMIGRWEMEKKTSEEVKGKRPNYNWDMHLCMNVSVHVCTKQESDG